MGSFKFNVIGVPVLNRGDLLFRFIKSINVDYEKLVIINNSYYDLNVNDNLNLINEYLNYNKKSFDIINNNCNIGVPRSWNYILREYDYNNYIIGSNDIILNKQDLYRLYFSILKLSKNPYLIVSRQERAHIMAYCFFCLNRKMIDDVGYFDEDFYPGFMEDIDYTMRVKLSGNYLMENEYSFYHGDDKKGGSSVTLFGSPFLSKNRYDIICNNNDLFLKKWGSFSVNECYRVPYNGINKDSFVKEVQGKNMKYLFNKNTLTIIYINDNYEDMVEMIKYVNILEYYYDNIKFICISSISNCYDLFNKHNYFYLNYIKNDIYIIVNKLIDMCMDGYLVILKNSLRINEIICSRFLDLINSEPIFELNNMYFIHKEFYKYKRYINNNLEMDNIIGGCSDAKSIR